ncbi:MAG TPA: hypothetical protein DCP92_24580 [Nitrospiraceae bacterium]|jgi:hypothetical protein|nr:hypothetical protein [Nitrospiraceae bacterium]
MAGTKGNQNAVGHEAYNKVDLDKEADALIEWSEKPDSTSLQQFTYHKDYLLASFDHFVKRSDRFRAALIKAKERIAFNRERLLHEGKFHQASFNKSAHVYDCLMKKQDRDDFVFKTEVQEQIKHKYSQQSALPPNNQNLINDSKEIESLDPGAIQSEATSVDQTSPETI